MRSSPSWPALPAALLVAILAAVALGGAGDAAPPPSPATPATPAPDALAAALSSDDPLTAFDAGERLVAAGPAAVAPLAALVASDARPTVRLAAVELIGRIGTPDAAASLIDRLKVEKDLAVRGQICMQIGPAGDRRAVPVLTDWLKTLAQSGINDVRGPKEVQPSTCFIRHLEALYMIGDPSAIPAIEAFAKGIPQGVGYGGFLTHFVTAGADEALTILRQKQAFADAVGRQAGLADRIAPLMEWFRTDRVARYRMYADKVTRVSPEGREILAAVAAGADAKLADAAGALLACYDRLK